MARQGRDLEKLVAILEKSLGPEGIQVTSPDYIRGKESQSIREVDISLRGKVGSTSVLVIFECRDRQEGEDVRWIEQLVSKRKDVGASRAVAVSSSGFTKGANNLAQANDIELRTLEQVDPNEILLWFGFREITGFNRKANFLHVSIQLAGPGNVDVQLHPDIVDKLQNTLETTVPVFRRKWDDRPASFRDIWWAFPLDTVYATIEPGSPKITRKIHLEFPDEQIRYHIQTIDGFEEIVSIDVNAELWISIEKKPLTAIHAYRVENDIVAQTAEFEVDHMGRKLVFSLHYHPESETQFVSVRSKDDDTPINLKLDLVSLNDVIGQLLVDVARAQSLISEDELLALMNRTHRYIDIDLISLNRILISISQREYREGRPLLAGVVTATGSDQPSPSFYELARELGLISGMSDQEFHLQEIQRVYGYWTAEESGDAT